MRTIALVLLSSQLVAADASVATPHGKPHECLTRVRRALATACPDDASCDEGSCRLACYGSCSRWLDDGRCDWWASMLEVSLQPETAAAIPWAQLGRDEHWWRHVGGVHARVEVVWDDADVNDEDVDPDRERIQMRRRAATARRVLDACLEK